MGMVLTVNFDIQQKTCFQRSFVTLFKEMSRSPVGLPPVRLVGSYLKLSCYGNFTALRLCHLP